MAVVRSACAFLAGCCAVLSLAVLPAGSTVATGIAAAALIAAVLRAWPILMLALGFGAAWHEVSDRLSQRLAPTLEGQTISIRGSVSSVPQLRADGVRFRFAPDAADGIPPLIELTWYEPEWRPRAAERLALDVRLRRPRGFSNPGGMDQEARLLRDCVGATGYVRGARSEGRGLRDVLRRPVLVARGEVYDAIRAALGERPATGIVAGLSVGLQDALSREQWRALARSGTSHLMAISGMHIGMQAAVAAWVAARIARWRQRRGALGAQRDAAVVAGTLTALAYALLAGWSVPTQRTVLMIALVGVALRVRRRIGVADGLALGSLAVLALDPLAPLAIGFWLSFVAVAVILFVGTGHVRQPGVLSGFAQVQLAVTIGLVPVIAGGFGSVSLVSAAVNAVAIPLYTLVIVPLVLLGTAAVLVAPAAGTATLGAVAWLIEAPWPLIDAPAALPFAVSGMATLPVTGWLLLTAGALAALAPLAMPGRLAGLLIVIALGLWRPVPPEHGALRLAVLDVGQGLATVVQTRRHVLVYDTGPLFRSGTDTGLLVVEPYLRSRGIRRVDLLVASHDDDDHVGGAASLSALLDVRARVASGRALDALGSVTRCRAGQGWEWDGVRFQWLHPGDPLPPGDNDRSCVLEVRAGSRTFLLAGDAERLAEQQMLDRGLAGPVDVVVVPHHGSRTSSSAAFVAALTPRWAVVSAGYRNRWGFPAASVVERWETAGAQVPRTSDSGAIEFDVNPDRPLDPPSRWRIDHPRPWADP
jgi:competence protein ComEC